MYHAVAERRVEASKIIDESYPMRHLSSTSERLKNHDRTDGKGPQSKQKKEGDVGTIYSRFTFRQ